MLDHHHAFDASRTMHEGMHKGLMHAIYGAWCGMSDDMSKQMIFRTETCFPNDR